MTTKEIMIGDIILLLSSIVELAINMLYTQVPENIKYESIWITKLVCDGETKSFNNQAKHLISPAMLPKEEG